MFLGELSQAQGQDLDVVGALASAGTGVGAHDRIVAATAIAAGWRVATANVRHFERVPGLDVVGIKLT